MNVISDSQAYVSVAATYTLGASHPWGASLTASARVALAEGNVTPELGPFIRVDASGADGIHGSFGPVVGVATVERADRGYVPYVQATGALGLQVGHGVGALVDVGVTKALNPYVTAPQSQTSIGLDGISITLDVSYSWRPTPAQDDPLPRYDSPGGPWRLGIGGQIALLPREYLLM